MREKTSQNLSTPFTKLLGCRLPIIAGPMFLVSEENLVVAVSEGGGIGGMPSLNWRKSEEFRRALKNVKKRTSNPYAVNLIVNKSNLRMGADLDICAEEKVPLLITSLGNPKEVIKAMHQVGGKVFCDVTNLEYAKKVQDMGADGVIAVASGAGGHAGPTSPLVLIPYLKKHLQIPIVAAGGIATGAQMAACFVLGASAVQVGTRFIASKEAKVDQAYKEAILNSEPEDIVLTQKISGTPASVINTPYVKKMGLHLNAIESYLMKNDLTKKYTKMARSLWGAFLLQKAAKSATWKEVWSAGQGVGLIDEILSVEEILERFTKEFHQAFVKS